MKNVCCYSEQNKDRISYLPELIQAHIVSFLTMKDATKSKILSSRWRQACSSLPNLEFNQYIFKEKKKFRDFVDETLILHDGSDVRRFSLHVKVDEEVITLNHVNAWISFAVHHNVTDFSLRFDFASMKFEKLPSCLFRSSTLTELSLEGSITGHDLELPVVIIFPVLKSLQVDTINFHRVTDKFFSSSTFPMLEDLVIDSCTMSIDTLSITIPTLKNIQYRISNGKVGPNVKLSIPNIRTINYQNYVQPAGVSLFQSCTALTKLSLNNIQELTFPTLIIFPVLKSFEVEDVTFCNFTNQFFSSHTFPTLEQLVMGDCTINDVSTLSITISTLKHIDYSMFFSEYEGPNVKLSIPNLQTISYEDYFPPDVSSSNLLSIIAATYFDFRVPGYNSDDSVGHLFHDSASKILTGMCNAKKLFLTSNFVENLARNEEFIAGLPAPQFNVKDLTLSWFRTKRNAQVVLFLLQNSPNLETLHIEINEPWDNRVELSIEESWQLKEWSSACIMEHLREVSISHVIGNPSEINIASYILEKASNLKEMKIFYSGKLENHSVLLKETIEKFSSFTALSSHVHISASLY